MALVETSSCEDLGQKGEAIWFSSSNQKVSRMESATPSLKVAGQVAAVSGRYEFDGDRRGSCE